MFRSTKHTGHLLCSVVESCACVFDQNVIGAVVFNSWCLA